MKTMTVDCVPLNSLHQRTVAVRFGLPGRDLLLYGRGVYQRDHELGQVLRIEFDSKADGEILLSEDEWNGEILSGDEVGCDFLVRLN